MLQQQLQRTQLKVQPQQPEARRTKRFTMLVKPLLIQWDKLLETALTLILLSEFRKVLELRLL